MFKGLDVKPILTNPANYPLPNNDGCAPAASRRLLRSEKDPSDSFGGNRARLTPQNDLHSTLRLGVLGQTRLGLPSFDLWHLDRLLHSFNHWYLDLLLDRDVHHLVHVLHLWNVH